MVLDVGAQGLESCVAVPLIRRAAKRQVLANDLETHVDIVPSVVHLASGVAIALSETAPGIDVDQSTSHLVKDRIELFLHALLKTSQIALFNGSGALFPFVCQVLEWMEMSNLLREK